jgi:hypothetical protein
MFMGFLIGIAWILLLTGAVSGANIEPVGVIGNSGEAGARLVRVGNLPFDRCATGVALDRDLTLWVSGGDAINRIGLDGRLIERIPLEPQGSIVNSRTFAVLNDTLYFLGITPEGKAALFGVPMRPGKGKRVAHPVLLALPERKRDRIPYCLAPQPLGGKLVLACEPAEFQEARIGIYLISPPTDETQSARISLAFSVSGESPQGIAVDEHRGILYLGGYFGLFVGGETHPMAFSIAAFKPDGTMLEGFPIPCPKTPAIPTQFLGVISLTGGALWDTAWYGFLARLSLKGEGAPGRIVEWHHELGYPTQVLCVAERGDQQLLAITTTMPDALYLARWDGREQRMDFLRRIGCLPVITGVGLSEDGWVTIGTERAQLWWRWEDAADAPPRKAELHIAVTPGYFDEGFFALAAQYRLDDLQKRSPVPAIFRHRVGERNEAERVGEPVPIREPTGLSVQVLAGKPQGMVFVADRATGRIWQAEFWRPGLRISGNWRPVKVEGTVLRAPTDIAALTDGRLLVADEGRIVVLTPDGDVYRLTEEFRGGEDEHQRLGKRLHFAVDGPWMLLSDTERHRVLLVDWSSWHVMGILGETDVAGDDLWHLNEPTFVALRGTKAIVADSGNQRVLKICLSAVGQGTIP